jgi:hypothetical protein
MPCMVLLERLMHTIMARVGVASLVETKELQEVVRNYHKLSGVVNSCIL